AEFDALGIPFDNKAGRTREYLEAMRAVWSEDQPSYDGRFVSFSGIRALPRPLQQPGPPVVFGGHVPGAFRRSVSHGHGWYGFGLDVDSTAKCIEGLAAAAAEVERPAALGELEISVTPFGNVDLDTARRYADAGVDRLIVLFPTQDPSQLFYLGATEQQILDYVNKLGDEVVGRI
ncbi:MAG: LLM class flavin-dependent oxidoreductase, partial [Gammaproteobacteria bacterium]